MVGTDYVDTTADSDYTIHMVLVVHTEAGTGSDTNWVENAQADMMLTLVHSEAAPHSSLSICQPFFPLGSSMLYNPSLHALLTYKIYKIGLQECLQSFSSIDSPHHDVLLSSICDTKVVHGNLMGLACRMRRNS